MNINRCRSALLLGLLITVVSSSPTAAQDNTLPASAAPLLAKLRTDLQGLDRTALIASARA